MNQLLAFLLLGFKVLGESSGNEPIEVRAFVGLDVTLPCNNTLPKDTEVPTVEWSKLELDPSPYVFVYRQNFEVYDEKHPDYEQRAHLFMKQVQYGNFSMRLSNVRKEDAGIYFCKTIWDRNHQNSFKLKLVVDVIPEPKMSVVLLESGEVTLSCQVSVCSLEARLLFWDGQDNALEAHEPKRSLETSTGCFTMTQRVTARTSAKSVVCRAEFAEINQSRDTHLLIPAETKDSCAAYMIYTGLGTAAFFIILAVVVRVVLKKCCGSAKKKNVSRQSTEESSNSNESRQLLGRPNEVAIKIPKIYETQNTLTQEPDLISSTSSSVSSKADGKASSLSSLFADANANANRTSDDAKLPTCELSEPSNPVKFKIKTKVTRQNACISDCPSLEKSLFSSSVDANDTNVAPAKKKTIYRSQSVSDSNPLPAFEEKNQRRRHSVNSVFSRSQKFEHLQEEPEQDSF